MRSVPILGLVILYVATVCQLAKAASCPVTAKYLFLNSIGAKNGSALYQVTVEATKPLKASVVLDLFGDSDQHIGIVQSGEAEFTNSRALMVQPPPRQVLLSFVWPLANIRSVKVAEVRDTTQSLRCESKLISLNPPEVVQGSWQFDDSALRGEPAVADVTSPIRIMNHVYPEYPEYAKETNQEGTAYVAATIGGSGEALATWIYKSSGVLLLDESSLKAATKMTFSAAKTSAGQPTAATIIIKFVFTLD